MLGKVIIGTEIDTKKFDKQIKYIEEQMAEIEDKLKRADRGEEVGDTSKLEAKYERLKIQLEGLLDKKKKLNEQSNNQMSEDAVKTTNAFEKMGNGLSKTIRKVAKWALAVFGIRSAYMAIRNAMNVIAGNDKQLQADIDYIKNIFAYTLEPIVRQIVEWAKQLLITIGTLIKQWTGKDIFGDADKKLKKANKQAKGLEKTLAGFDELNIIGNKDGEGDVAPSFSLGDLDTSGDPFEWLRARWEDIVSWVSEKWKELTNFFENTDWAGLGMRVYQGVKDWFLSVDWASISQSIFEGLGSIAGGLLGYVVGILTGLWDDVSSYFGEWIDKSKELGGNVIDGVLAGILNGIAQIGIWIYNNVLVPFVNGFKKAFGIASPSKVMAELGGFIVDGFVGALSGIWSKVSSIINTLKTNMVKAFKSIWDGIKSVFSSVGTFFQNTFSTAWNKVKNIFSTGGKVFDGIKDGIVSTFKSIVNKLIDGINKVIATPFNKINDALDTIKKISILGAKPFSGLPTISVPKIPHLARGGIVNNPGAGVMMGNYIAGEKGAEAVIPLTDDTLQRLANMIPINIDLTNKLDSRVIGKQMINITNDKNFARNGG